MLDATRTLENQQQHSLLLMLLRTIFSMMMVLMRVRMTLDIFQMNH